MFVDQILNRIRVYRRQNGYSIFGFAKFGGVSETALRGIDDPDWNPQVKTIRKFEAVIPAKFMRAANDTVDVSPAAPADRGDDQHEAA